MCYSSFLYRSKEADDKQGPSIFQEDQKDHVEINGIKCPKGSFKELYYLKELVKRDGIRSFYKGLSSGLIGVVFSFGIYFWWYRFFKNFFKHVMKREELSELDISIITFFSGTINSLLTSPIWFLNTRMTISKDNKGLVATIKEIYQKEGLGAFYKGVLPNMLLVINPMINFVIYEGLKKFLLKKKFTLNVAQLLAITSFAKAIATIFTFPILTVRVKMQANKEEQKESLPSQILKIVKAAGLEGLYLGVFAKMVQTILYNAFLMVVYERLRLLIKYLLIKRLHRGGK